MAASKWQTGRVLWWADVEGLCGGLEQAGSDKAAATAVGWLPLGVSEQAYIGGNGGMEEWKEEREWKRKGGQDARCEVWDWLEEGKGGNGRSRKTSGSPERDLVVSRPRSLCTSPLLAPDRRRTARDLDNNYDDISRQQEWQIKTALPCFALFYWRGLQRVSSCAA